MDISFRGYLDRLAWHYSHVQMYMGDDIIIGGEGGED